MSEAGSRTIAVGVCVVAVAAPIALLGADGTAHVTTYGGVSTTFAVLEAVTGIGLIATALLLIFERFDATLSLLALAAAAAWIAPVWVGWEGGLAAARSLGLVVAPLLPALVLGIAAQLPPARRGRGRSLLRWLAAGMIALTAVFALALVLVRDPIRDLYCWSDCAANAFLAYDDLSVARRLRDAVLCLGAASGLIAALVCAVRAARASTAALRPARASLSAAGLAGLALAAYALALLVEPREVPTNQLWDALFVMRAVALLLLAAGLAWLALRPRLVRGRVTHLAVDLERTSREGGLAGVLAQALGDPDLRLGYPIGPGERSVDADGRGLALDPARQITTIVGADGPVAVVESDTTSIETLERELGPAARLALGNERLRAEALARLADATSSRARIVETADATRRRMERDLHDGAQQRMLALTYDLRVALEIAEASSRTGVPTLLRQAVDRAVAASRELREVAHGIFPAELTTSGLEAALELLADTRPLALAVHVPAGSRYSPELEATVYTVVAEATEDAGPVRVTIVGEPDALRLTIEGAVPWDERLVRLEDRLGAMGGSAHASERRLEGTLPVSRD